MKFSPTLSRARAAGFTLVEMYTCLAVFTFLVVALVTCQIFAMKIYTLAATKLTATAAARNAMSLIRNQVRAGSGTFVGIYNPATQIFTNIPDGSLQIGNALFITTNTAQTLGTIYYMNQTISNLSSIQVTSGGVQSSTLTPLIIYITNYYVFDAEDAYTNIVTTYVNNHVIHAKVQFAEWEYPLAGVVGQNAMYDYYQLQTRATRRLFDY